MMSVFNQFPVFPSLGQVTLCEVNGDLLMGQPRDDGNYNKLPGYPDVQLKKTKDSSTRALFRDSAKSAFLIQNESVWNRIMNAWCEQGLSGAMEELANDKHEAPIWISGVARKTIGTVRWAHSLHESLFPHLALSSEDMVSHFSRVRSWSSCSVRFLAWHPHMLKLAVVMSDDTVKIHSAGSEIVPTLKFKLQKHVACAAWQPLNSSVLAIGCQSCVLVWIVEPTSLATRPSASAVQVLQQNGHGPVTSLAWNPSGVLLLSASPADTAIMVWDVTMEQCIPLRRYGGGGVSLLEWSPDGSLVFAANPSPIFRVWETRTWTCEKWSNLSGSCQAACWSPDGSVLLFATSNEAVIYSLTFRDSSTDDPNKQVGGGSATAMVCLDLSEAEIYDEDGETVKVGGCIQNMIWDARAERLAIMFQGRGDTVDDRSRVIALFRTKCSPILEISPCGFIMGEEDEVPQSIAFQPKFDKGALLTVVWSSGRIAYIPLYYIAMDTVNYNQFLQQHHHQTTMSSQGPSLYSSQLHTSTVEAE